MVFLLSIYTRRRHLRIISRREQEYILVLWRQAPLVRIPLLCKGQFLNYCYTMAQCSHVLQCSVGGLSSFQEWRNRAFMDSIFIQPLTNALSDEVVSLLTIFPDSLGLLPWLTSSQEICLLSASFRHVSSQIDLSLFIRPSRFFCVPMTLPWRYLAPYRTFVSFSPRVCKMS